MKNKQIRRFFCVLLVLCLLCSCIAVPVFATEAALFAVKSVTASLAMDGLIRGLGVLPVDSESGAFGTLVNNCVSYVESVSDFIVDGVCKVSGVRTGNGFTSYLPIGVAQLVWEWLFTDSSGASLSDNRFYPYYTTDSCSSYAQAIAYASHCPAAYRGTRTINGQLCDCIVVTDSNSQYVSFSDGTLSIEGYGANHSVWYSGRTSWAVFGSPSVTYYYTNAVQLATSPLVQTSNNGLTLGEIQSPVYGVSTPISLPNAPVYAPWTEHTYSIPSYSNQDEFVSGLPVSIPDSSTSALTQSQAQAGTNSLDWAQADTDTDSVTLTSILDAVISLPSAFVGTITTALSNFFSISGTASNYGIQLKDFFPFCIPFDIYDFLTVLAAEPVAPVFEWEIPVPWLGQSYPLTVDLADWEPVAVLFRTFELLAFIIGLAIITRKNFLRS